MAVLVKTSRWKNCLSDEMWSVWGIQIWKNMFITMRRERMFNDSALSSQSTWEVWSSQMKLSTVTCKIFFIKQGTCDVHWVWPPNNGGPWEVKNFHSLKLLYFVVSNDQPLRAYVNQCKIYMHMTTPNMSSSFEFLSYVNVTLTIGLLDAISQNLYLSLIEKVKKIQFIPY